MDARVATSRRLGKVENSAEKLARLEHGDAGRQITDAFGRTYREMVGPGLGTYSLSDKRNGPTMALLFEAPRTLRLESWKNRRLSSPAGLRICLIANVSARSFYRSCSVW